MSNRYAPLPNPRSNRDADAELDAAFDDEEDEDDNRSDDGLDATESQPLNPISTSTPTPHLPPPVPGAYDFENVDYDYPPPGSPPRPSDRALPNEYGNSNGRVPDVFDVDARAGTARGAGGGWLGRTAAGLLPSHYVQRWGLAPPRRPAGAVGGGLNNDGVFANVTAKPTRPVRIQDGDETYLVPEDVGTEAPPSYAHAQADSVPPYWETTVHAPSSPSEILVDSLPTGSLFSFAWNLLVSVSFQFVGFLLTYLLHTTHAARCGSRAGLGITLIQYGFALGGRGKSDGVLGGGWRTGDMGAVDESAPPAPAPTFATAAEEEAYRKSLGWNGTIPTPTFGSTTLDQQNEAAELVADATTEWLSFFLMTAGWFILLTSVLGYWRVKRWESKILGTQQPGAAATAPTSLAAQEQMQRSIATLEAAFPGLAAPPEDDATRQRREEQEARARAREERLREDLRAAGFL